MSQAVNIGWFIPENPKGKTVRDGDIVGTDAEGHPIYEAITLGQVVSIAILDVTEGNPKNKEEFEKAIVRQEKATAWDGNTFNGHGLTATVNGKAEVTLEVNDPSKIYAIVVIDKDGHFFGTGPIQEGSLGWNDGSETLNSYTTTWYNDAPAGKINGLEQGWPPQGDGGWAFAGPYGVVPEPSVFAGILLGTVLMLSRRKKQA